jgi:hypothetical protein
MKIRTLCVAGLATAVTLTAGCVALYTNPGQCETVMRERLAETSLGAMTVTHTSVAYRGSRVVVEGELPRPASAAVAASVAGSADREQEADAAASAPEAASAPTSGLNAWFARFKHKRGKPIAAECTFNESGLTSFRWLAPAELAKTTPDED